ncbi:hypothetical protein [Elstera sp.]|jgi:hypothetical protein|uniref:hypothetical protein n=1 Tax=Elstera sp. TaxID=1916664 RepID=UPI0037BE2D84
MSPSRAPRRYFSAEEDAILRRLYPRGGQADLLAALPGRNWKGITMRAHRLGLYREVREGLGEFHRWQADQDAEVIAELTVSQFGRRNRDIAGLVARLGLPRGRVEYRVRLLADTLGAGR